MEAVEVGLCYIFENWLTKHKIPNLLKPLGTIVHQNSQFYYPPEPFSFHHLTLRHPVQSTCTFPCKANIFLEIIKCLSLIIKLLIIFYRIIPLHSQLPREDQRLVFSHVPDGVTKVRILCLKFSLNSLRFSLTRETDSKITRAKCWAIVNNF